MRVPKREVYIRVYGGVRVATYRPSDCATVYTDNEAILHRVPLPKEALKEMHEVALLLLCLQNSPILLLDTHLSSQNQSCEMYIRQTHNVPEGLQDGMNDIDKVCELCGLRSLCTNATFIACRDDEYGKRWWILPGLLNNYVTDFRLSEAETYGLTEIIAEKMKVDIIYATALFLITSLYFIYGTPAILTTLYLIALRIFIELLIRSSKHQRKGELVSYIGLEEVDDAGYFALPKLGHESRITRSEYDKLFNLLQNINTVRQIKTPLCGNHVAERIINEKLRRRKKWSYYKDMLIEALHTALSAIKDYVVSLAK